MATIVEFEGKTPQIHDSVFVASTAVIIGDVLVKEGPVSGMARSYAVTQGSSALVRKPTYKTMS